MSATFKTTPDHQLKTYPSGVPYIVGNEGCERFSYYGMKAILYVFLWKYYIAQGIFNDPAQAQSEATAVVHLFNTGVYAFPMIGAILADRLLGKYHVILYLSIIYCIGHGFLAVFEENLTGFYAGLALIAIGSGGIKPCVSAHVGDQFGRGNMHLLGRVYRWFYFIINFGSTFASLMIPLFLEWWGPSWAFGIPGILMAIATFVFWLGRNSFIHVQAEPAGKLGLLDSISGTLMFLTVGSLFFTANLSFGIKVLTSLSFLMSGLLVFFYRQKIQQDDGFLATTLLAIKDYFQGNRIVKDPQLNETQNHWFYGKAAREHGETRAEGPIAVWKIISIFLMVSVFWALFDQHSSTWIRQAEAMNLTVQIPFFLQGIIGSEVTLLASQVPACNPILVMMLIPFCSLVLYPFIDKYIMKLNPLRTMTMGMFITASSFLAVYFIQKAIDSQGIGIVPVQWQLIAYGLITLGEVMVSITGLEFAYTQAPARMKSTVMGFWLLTVSLGNVLTALLAKFANLELADFFLVFAGLMAIASCIFGLRAKFYKIKNFTH